MINLMADRYETLKSVLDGYLKTGVQLVSFDGSNFVSAGCSDDLGLYYFVPKLARFFDISLGSAINLFFYGIIFFSSVLALVGFFLLSKSWLFRIFVVLGLCGFFLAGYRGVGDVYIVNAAIVFAIVPLATYFFRARYGEVLSSRAKAGGSMGLFFSGVTIGYANQIRSHAGLSVFIFLTLGIFFLLSATCKKKFLLFGFLCAGMLVPTVHFNCLLAQRDNALGNQMVQCSPSHVFWHTVYAGFGFLQNKFGIAYDDKTIAEKVYEQHPGVVYPTKAYERVTKQEVFKLVRKHPSFVLRTLFAKLGVMFYFLLLFANIGLLVAFFYRKPWILELMFWVGIAASSLPGFIALPSRVYLLGLFAFAMVYGLVSIEHALSCGVLQDIKRLFKQKRT